MYPLVPCRTPTMLCHCPSLTVCVEVRLNWYVILCVPERTQKLTVPLEVRESWYSPLWLPRCSIITPAAVAVVLIQAATVRSPEPDNEAPLGKVTLLPAPLKPSA